MPEPERRPFQYAVLRVVPRVERGECVNAAVVLFCRQKGFLEVRTALDDARLTALAPGIDLGAVRAHLRALERVAAGDPEAGALARLDQSERFHWIVAPSSTIVQSSPVHTGLCADPEAELAHLVDTLVTAPAP